MAPTFSVVAARNATIRVVQLAKGDETSRRAGVPGVLGDVGFLDVERSSDRYSPNVPRSGASGRVLGADLQHLVGSPEAIRTVQTSEPAIQYEHCGEVDVVTIVEPTKAGAVTTRQRGRSSWGLPVQQTKRGTAVPPVLRCSRPVEWAASFVVGVARWPPAKAGADVAVQF